MRLLILLVATALAAGPGEDWPQFRGNPQLTGVAPTALPATLKVLWTYEAGDAIESSAAIADGAVYVGVGNGELVALDLASGALRWKYKSKDLIGESSPAVGLGTVYMADLGGVVHAVNARDGKAKWTFPTGSEVKSSPVVVGDKVLIGSYDEHLYCLNAADGKLQWKFQISRPVHCTPGIGDGLAYISGCDETFRAIRIADGKEMFQFSSGAYTGASPVLAGGWAYFGTFNNEVLGVDLKTRKIVWRYEHAERKFPFYSTAAVTAGKVVVGGRD